MKKLLMIVLFFVYLNSLALGQKQELQDKLWNYSKNYSQLNFILLKEIVAQGADINYKYNNGQTILFNAVIYGYINFIQYLIENSKLDVNSQDSDGLTPLHLAIKCVEEEIQRGLRQGELDLNKIEYLVSQNANIYLKDRNGQSPLYLVKELNKKYNGHLKDALYILEKKQSELEAKEVQDQINQQDLLPEVIANIIGQYIREPLKSKK